MKEKARGGGLEAKESVGKSKALMVMKVDFGEQYGGVKKVKLCQENLHNLHQLARQICQ